MLEVAMEIFGHYYLERGLTALQASALLFLCTLLTL